MNYTLKRISIFTCVTLSLLIISCTTTDESTDNAVNFSVEDTARAAKADAVIDGSLNIMENGIDENVEASRTFPNSLFPECTQITLTSNGNGGTIVLDFGDACELNNGAIVSGIINLEYSPILSGTRTITYSFENYVYNGNGVAGGGEIFRQIANANGNPQSTVNESIVVSFPNTPITATRNGLRIAEWVEGVDSGTWLDNVYHITGNWNTTFTNGFQRTGEVTQTLVRKLNCLFFVSGVLEITQENFTASIDYGSGECDNQATITINGQDFPIGL